MRVEVLSNHPLAQVQALRAAIDDVARRRTEHLRAVEVLRWDNAASRRWWELHRWWRHRQQEAAMLRATPQVDPVMVQELAMYEAGAAAEIRAAQELMSCFDDEWMLFVGYTNRRGEVDLMLVGPKGIWAVEVKGRRVQVHVDGDDWTFDKYDRFGNHVEFGKLQDGGGRSWSRQVSDVAEELQNFLRRRSVFATVFPAVVLMHDGAEIGSCRDLRVALTLGARDLVHRVCAAPGALTTEQRAATEDLIRRDHAFHQRRRQR